MGDKYEQEADQVAEQVMKMPAPMPINPIPRQDQQQWVHPKSEHPFQHLFGQRADQAVLDTSQPPYPFVAQMVQRRTQPLHQPIASSAGSDQASSQTETQLNHNSAQSSQAQATGWTPPEPHPFVSRMTQRSTQPSIPWVSTQSLLQRAASSAESQKTNSDLETQLNNSKGSGTPLTDEARSFMEPRFGADFSSVRVHTGSTAVQMNKELGAQAFTHGSDIYFNDGKFNPSSNEGNGLLAHELTHVVQQTGAKKLQTKPLTNWHSNKETAQLKISTVPAFDLSPKTALQLKENTTPQSELTQPTNLIQKNPTEAATTPSEQTQTVGSANEQSEDDGGFFGGLGKLGQIKDLLGKVLSGAAGAIWAIIKNPVGFLGNLVSGLRQGFMNFVGNIGTHLQSGLVGWLTGTLGPMGIQLPDDLFSLKGIFGLVTQVLGVTAEYIRSKAVKMFGDATVARMEKSVAIFQVVSQGLEALWEHVSEQFTDLKETVIGEIKNLVITQVIQAGVKWILSLLNPVSGLIKAAMGIYDIITFFMNRASQIMDLVNAVIEAVKAIAAGQLSGAASLVENALVRSLPVMIGFLASLLGVNGLATKVQNIVKKIRTRIDKAIDQFLLKAKRLSKGDKGKDNKDKNSNEAQEGKVSDEEGPEHDLKVKTGLTQLEQEQARYLKNGAITQEDAEKVAAKVKKDNPVFKSIEVVDGQDAWDYTYVASPKRTRSGAKKAEDSADNSVNARELLHNARDNWNEAKRRYVPKSKMAPLLKLRTEVVGKIITDIQKETPVDAEITSNNQSVAKLPAEPQPAFKPIAPGSGDPTSDYDVTFSAGRGDKKAEIFAVKRFNEVFRGEWKKESGTVFDTNVYTTGHMPKTSSNTPTSDAFGATNKEIEDLEYKEKKGRITEEEKLRIQDLQEERNSLSKQLGKEIDDEKENKWGNLVSSDKFNVDQDIMSLVKIRRFMSQREWNRYKKDMLKPYQRVPGKEALYQETERRLTAAEKFYNDSERDLQVKLAEVRAAKKLPSPAAQKGKTDGRLLASKELKEAEDNAVLQASNELYVQCLEKVEEVLRKIDKVEQRKQENPKGTEVTELDELIYEFHLHHSKGLYYANEAYIQEALLSMLYLTSK